MWPHVIWHILMIDISSETPYKVTGKMPDRKVVINRRCIYNILTHTNKQDKTHII